MHIQAEQATVQYIILLRIRFMYVVLITIMVIEYDFLSFDVLKYLDTMQQVALLKRQP